MIPLRIDMNDESVKELVRQAEAAIAAAAPCIRCSGPTTENAHPGLWRGRPGAICGACWGDSPSRLLEANPYDVAPGSLPTEPVLVEKEGRL
jgi:hypothetical protein